MKYIGDATFINQLVDFDKDNMTDKVLKKIGTYVNNPDFKPDLVGRVSGAAKSLCMWVRAMEVYGRIYRVVEPKRKVCCNDYIYHTGRCLFITLQRLEEANRKLAEKQAILAEAKSRLKEVRNYVQLKSK